MNLNLTLILAVAAGLCACSTPSPTPITLTEYERLQNAPAIKAKRFKVSWSLEDEKGQRQEFQSAFANRGQEIEIKPSNHVREFIYPTDFSLPSLKSSSGAPASTSVIPTTPTAFSSREAGTKLRVTVNTQGAFVTIAGVVERTSITSSNRSLGDATRPIISGLGSKLLTENLLILPEIKSTESLFYVAGAPGKEQLVELSEQRMKLFIRCDVLD